MSVTVTGQRSLLKQFDDLIARAEKSIAERRKAVARELTEMLVANMPVWSGRAVSSLTWSNTGKLMPYAPHPQRGDYKEDGWFMADYAYGPTSRMPLGPEPMRRSAEAGVYASLETIDYGLKSSVVLTSNAVMWGRINAAKAPEPGNARNKAVVKDLAISAVKSKYGLK